MTTFQATPEQRRIYRGRGYPMTWRDAVADQYEAGLSIRVIAEQSGMAYATVHGIVSEVLPLRPRGGRGHGHEQRWGALAKRRARMIREAVRMRCVHELTFVAIAREFGVRPTTVRAWHHKHPYALALRRYVYGEKVGPSNRHEHISAMRRARVPEAAIERLQRDMKGTQ